MASFFIEIIELLKRADVKWASLWEQLRIITGDSWTTQVLQIMALQAVANPPHNLIVGPPYLQFHICELNWLWITQYCSIYLSAYKWTMDSSSNPCCSFVLHCGSTVLWEEIWQNGKIGLKFRLSFKQLHDLG